MSKFDPNQPVQPFPNQPQWQPTPPQHQGPKKKHTGRNIFLAALGTLTVIGVAASLGGSPEPAADKLPNVVTTTTATTAPPAPKATPTQPPKTTAPVVPKVTQTTPKPKPVVYKKLTKREWAKIAKSPDTHAGEAYTVYGVVTQFDSATGDEQFRADVDGVKHSPSYGFVDYPTNTLMTNISGDMSDLVEDDLFTAKVVVIGAFSYDTQIGGETTVPQLSVMSISVTGSTK